MISIVIPALNEEKYLPLLLESIRRQNFNGEIIVADAGSSDKTVKIAKTCGCLVVSGGLPAKGRNQGAKVAIGDVLMFLDADSVLPKDFFEKAEKEFDQRGLDLATFCLIPFPKSKFSSFMLNLFYNRPIRILEEILPHAAMGIMVKKEIFSKTEGFDEDVKLAEDHYFARQAVKLLGAKFGVIRSVKIFISDRRFREDGWVATCIKFFLCELHLIFLGPVKSDIFNYKFAHYQKKQNQ